jgi:nicotinamidase-related amidase
MGVAEIKEPAPSRAALLVIDMINDLEFEEGKQLLPHATAAARSIHALGKAARGAGVPVVYVNDNYGQWHSERSLIVEHCSREGALGRDVVRSLEPEDEDYFVMKPQFSGFYSTNLPALAAARRAAADSDRRLGRHLRPLHRRRRSHARI